jgi:hypothetical protein
MGFTGTGSMMGLEANTGPFEAGLLGLAESLETSEELGLLVATQALLSLSLEILPQPSIKAETPT